MCAAPDGFRFPGKQDATGECDDGDMTLFAGLLCAAGEEIGCETVRRSQEPSGRWFRSPRRAQTGNLGGPNSFSPDMALGAQLYLASKRDELAGTNWLKWLDQVRPCWIGQGDDCFKGPFLRFCTDDTEKGCAMRPGDAAILDATVKYVPLTPPTQDMRNLLSQAGKNLLDLVWASAQLNKPGFSQHLTSVEIFLLRKMGYSDAKLDTAAFALSQKQPENPFFAYLNEGRTAHVRDLTVTHCPSPASGLPTARNEWAWERQDSDLAWKRSMLWECIFIARLLEGI